MKLVTIYLPNGSKIKIECDDTKEVGYVKADGEIRPDFDVVLYRDGVAIAKFAMRNIAGYQIEEFTIIEH